jgi:hypothetical protein
VATLSGVGVSWYTWLEQGRVSASRQVLDAVGRALRLDETEHRHLLELTGYHPQPPAPGNTIDRRLRALLNGGTATPAAVLDDRLDVLAPNSAWAALWLAGCPAEPNLLCWLLTDPAAAELLPDHEPLAQDLFRHLRAAADRTPDDVRLRAVLDRLATERPDLARWWRCRRVGAFPGWTVSVHHPVHGTFRQAWTMLRPTGHPNWRYSPGHPHPAGRDPADPRTRARGPPARTRTGPSPPRGAAAASKGSGRAQAGEGGIDEAVGLAWRVVDTDPGGRVHQRDQVVVGSAAAQLTVPAGPGGDPVGERPPAAGGQRPKPRMSGIAVCPPRHPCLQSRTGTTRLLGIDCS